METLGIILPIIIYFLLICLLIIGIILGIKLIITIDTINEVVDDIRRKIDTLNDVFAMLDYAKNKVSSIGNKLTSGVMSFINKLLGLSKGKEDDDYE